MGPGVLARALFLAVGPGVVVGPGMLARALFLTVGPGVVAQGLDGSTGPFPHGGSRGGRPGAFPHGGSRGGRLGVCPNGGARGRFWSSGGGGGETLLSYLDSSPISSNKNLNLTKASVF